MAGERRQVNWHGVIFTDSSNNNTTLTGVTQVGLDNNGVKKEFSGDIDRFNTTIIVPMSNPIVTVTCADLQAIMALALGTRGTLAAVHKDARSLTSSLAAGDMSYALSNAILTDSNLSGSKDEIGSGRLIFGAESSDGSTNPLAVTVTSS